MPSLARTSLSCSLEPQKWSFYNTILYLLPNEVTVGFYMLGMLIEDNIWSFCMVTWYAQNTSENKVFHELPGPMHLTDCLKFEPWPYYLLRHALDLSTVGCFFTFQVTRLLIHKSRVTWFYSTTLGDSTQFAHKGGVDATKVNCGIK